MVKRKKHQIHCVCGLPVEVYKKGKGHRVFICPNCGIIATNPLPLLAGLASAALPSILEGVSKVTSPKEKKSGGNHQTFDSLDKPNKGERYVNLVMGK